MAYNPVIQNDDTERLFEAVLKLENVDECYRFFEDLCTVKEIIAMSQRMHVARMLDDEETYHDIVDKTGASTATISRVNRCLHYGAGGYRLMLDRTKKEQRQG